MSSANYHNPVLIAAVLDQIAPKGKKLVVDGTLGLGGYSRAVLEEDSRVQVAGFDLDENNLRQAQANLAEFKDRVVFYRANFAKMKELLGADGRLPVDGIMLDLGLASTQVDQAERGFSFLRDGDLDMRFDSRQSLTAREVVNTYSVERLAQIFRQYGEEKKARLLARAMVERRREKPFQRTVELADFVAGVLGGRKGRIHPATKVFQALRIEVNAELDTLAGVLNDSVDVLSDKARIAVVSYHSLEDRLVKNFFRDQSRQYVNLPDKLTTTYLQPKLKVITKKPIVPAAAEVAANPRARSARLRVAEKI